MITFTPIIPEYSRGTYDEISIIIHDRTSYVNATHICLTGVDLYGTRKDIYSWRTTRTANNLIYSTSRHTKLNKIDLITVFHNSNKMVQGVYVHPDLIPHVATWVNPKIAMAVGYIIRRHVEDRSATAVAIPPKPTETVPPRQNYVYFAQAHICRVINMKIGATHDICKELNIIQEYHHERISLIDSIQCNEPARVLARIRQIFMNFHVHGDWYRADYMVVFGMIKIVKGEAAIAHW